MMWALIASAHALHGGWHVRAQLAEAECHALAMPVLVMWDGGF